MRRYLASALILSSFSMFALVGCEDKSADVKTEKVTTPTGTTEKEVTTKVESSGSTPPTTSAGETGKDAMAPPEVTSVRAEHYQRPPPNAGGVFMRLDWSAILHVADRLASPLRLHPWS